MSTYTTIKQNQSAEFKDRGSRFIAYAIRVSSKEEAEQNVAKLHDQHPKSRHVCYAYQLQNEYRANDDGEPSGSAGLPILNQIKSAGVQNTLVAVVRYFGGTKLGVSGLINAYKISAKEALEKSETIETEDEISFIIKFDYALMEASMSFIKSKNAIVCKQVYEEKCTLHLQIRKSQHHEFQTYFTNLKVDIS
ncbi:MAG: IMPACT family protein [Bacteroidia bacterium]